MRLGVASVFLLVSGASACGAITGLNAYSDGTSSDDAAMLEGPDADETTDDGATSDESSADSSNDGASDRETSTAPPPCDSDHCGGCCMNGICYGGASVSSCGISAALCIDCTNKGGACSATGTCTTPTPPKDSGTTAPTCNASKCIACAPVYQKGCCKSDGTCGCQVQIPPSNSCN